MKKIFLTVITCIIIIQAFGQINPIKNLNWSHTYQYPSNCFSLSWEIPDTSLTDTLVGYNIYRDDNLYMFTTDLFHDCNPCIGMPIGAFCDFLNFNMGIFYIHVTAVYNLNNIESTYNDSVYNPGIVIDVQETNREKMGNIITYPNPTNNKFYISTDLVISDLSLINIDGKTVKQFDKNEKELDVSSILKGVYFIKAVTEKGTIIKKVVLE